MQKTYKPWNVKPGMRTTVSDLGRRLVVEVTGSPIKMRNKFSGENYWQIPIKIVSSGSRLMYPPLFPWSHLSLYREDVFKVAE